MRPLRTDLRPFGQRRLVQTAKHRLPQSIDGPLAQHLSPKKRVGHPIVDVGEILLPESRGQVVLGIGQIVRVGQAIREGLYLSRLEPRVKRQRPYAVSKHEKGQIVSAGLVRIHLLPFVEQPALLHIQGQRALRVHVRDERLHQHLQSLAGRGMILRIEAEITVGAVKMRADRAHRPVLRGG